MIDIFYAALTLVVIFATLFLGWQYVTGDLADKEQER